MRSSGCVLAVLAAGCGRLGFEPEIRAMRFVDADEQMFDRGSYDTGSAPLVWREGRVELAGTPPFDPAGVGMFVSRPFDTGSSDTTWATLAWIPSAPSGKPLPDAGDADVGYAEAAISMTSTHLMLHLDGAGDAAHGDPVIDSSGNLNHGRIVLAGQGARYAPGVFGQAADLDRDAWVRLDGAEYDLGRGDFTYAIWVRMFDCAQSNDNRIAIGGAGMGDTPHMWLGARCPDPCGGGDGAFMNFLDGTRAGASLSPCTGIVLEDGTWHHLAGVKQGHTAPAASLRLYVDGIEVQTTTHDYGAGTFDYDGGEIRLGSFNLSDPQYHTRIVVDEAAMWKRALTAEEIQALYRRGAVKVALQFRVCPDRVCDDEPFIGPDGTPATMFTEADLIGPAGSQRDNLVGLGLVGAVAQYRAVFSTELAAVSPGLVSVTIDSR